MSQFEIEVDNKGEPNCLVELRDVDFERGEELTHSVMREVDGLATVGCSGGRTITIKIHGSSIQSVIEAVQYCVDSDVTVRPAR